MENLTNLRDSLQVNYIQIKVKGKQFTGKSSIHTEKSNHIGKQQQLRTVLKLCTNTGNISYIEVIHIQVKSNLNGELQQLRGHSAGKYHIHTVKTWYKLK